MKNFICSNAYIIGILASFLLSVNSHAAKKQISLKGVIEQGIRKNSQEKIRRYQEEIEDLNWKDTFYSYWYPNMKLTLESDLMELYKISNGSEFDGRTRNTSIVPTNTIKFELGEYTLFNWGQEHLKFLNSKEKYGRKKESFKEKRRELKLQLIAEYFKLDKFINQRRAHEDQLRHSSFVYRLSREKARTNKISSAEFYKARIEYLRSQREYQASKVFVRNQEQVISSLTADDPKTNYETVDSIDFKKHRYPLQAAINKALSNNDHIEDLKAKMSIANRKQELARKESLPLPKIAVNLGTYTYGSYQDGAATSFETQENNTDVEVVATVSATWDILGGSGFFNHRDRERAVVERNMAHYEYYDFKRELELRIRSLYEKLEYYESLIKVGEVSSKNASKAFDSILESYIKGKSNFDDYRIALRESKESDVQYEEAKFNYLNLRLNLANLVGVDDFPGESFENIANKKLIKEKE